MNKEVIYLEPEDDITDILTKLQGAEQKLVALVPPKKATMLRSAVNMKLVARAAKECDKVAVIVTADPAIVKQAMMAQIPVAKTLQSRPVVPTKESLAASETEEQVIDEDLSEDEKSENAAPKGPKSAKIAAEGASSASETAKAKSANVYDLSDKDLSEGQEKGNKSQKTAKNGQKVPNFDKYRKWIILGAAAVILLVVFGVWALVFAPAVKITVAMSTSANNFSENIFFTTDANAANAAEGKFYVEKQSDVDKFETEFSATGQEDRGDKAKGAVEIAYTLTAAFIAENLNKGTTIEVPAGSQLVSNENGLGYHTAEALNLAWDGTIGPTSTCKSSSSCKLSGTVPVEANNSGANYDLGTKGTWVTTSLPGPVNTSLAVTTTTAISGGSSKMVTVVTQADVNKAADARNDSSSVDHKAELLAQIPKDSVAIEASYSVETGELKATPAVGEEATGPVKLTAETTYSIYTISKDQIDEFVKAKTQLGEDQKIYSIGDTYVERFTNIEEGARLKAVVKTGPTVTEEDILNRSLGRKTGEVQSLLRSINGVSSVTVKPSYFWVRKVPQNADKVTVELTVEDN